MAFEPSRAKKLAVYLGCRKPLCQWVVFQYTAVIDESGGLTYGQQRSHKCVTREVRSHTTPGDPGSRFMSVVWKHGTNARNGVQSCREISPMGTANAAAAKVPHVGTTSFVEGSSILISAFDEFLENVVKLFGNLSEGFGRLFL
jgi:hypothetical protein